MNDTRKLCHALVNHVVCRFAHGLHGHSTEIVWQHCSKEKACECPRILNVHILDLGARTECPKERQAYESRASDCETLTNCCCSVASSIQGICTFTYLRP